MWFAVKFFLSLVLLALAGLIAFAYIGRAASWEMLAFAAALSFLVLPLWVTYEQSKGVMPIFGIGLSIAAGIAGLRIALGYLTPRFSECSGGKGRFACEALNSLYALGGPGAIAALWLITAGILLYLSCVALKQDAKRDP